MEPLWPAERRKSCMRIPARALWKMPLSNSSVLAKDCCESDPECVPKGVSRESARPAHTDLCVDFRPLVRAATIRRGLVPEYRKGNGRGRSTVYSNDLA